MTPEMPDVEFLEYVAKILEGPGLMAEAKRLREIAERLDYLEQWYVSGCEDDDDA